MPTWLDPYAQLAASHALSIINRHCIVLLLVRHTELLVLVPASQTSVGLHCFNLQVHSVTVDGKQAQVGSSCSKSPVTSAW
jgi:hypothetical protein